MMIRTMLLVLVAGLFGCATPSSEVEMLGTVSSGPPPFEQPIARINRTGHTYTTTYHKNGTMESTMPYGRGCGPPIPCNDSGRWSLMEFQGVKVFCTRYDRWRNGANQCGYMRASIPAEPNEALAKPKH